MDLLLDTHVLLWWDRQDKGLGAPARAAITDTANQVFVSAASIWEIAIKRRTGKLAFQGSPTGMIEANGFLALPIFPVDAEMAGAMAWAHTDPFDRMLVAQAARARLVLVTADARIRERQGTAIMWAG